MQFPFLKLNLKTLCQGLYPTPFYTQTFDFKSVLSFCTAVIIVGNLAIVKYLLEKRNCVCQVTYPQVPQK